MIVVSLSQLRLKSAHLSFYTDTMVALVKRTGSVVVGRAIMYMCMKEEVRGGVKKTAF